MLTLFLYLIKDKSGVTAIEYALIAALIAVAAIAAFTLVGTNLSTTFSYVASQLYNNNDWPRRRVFEFRRRRCLAPESSAEMRHFACRQRIWRLR